MAVLLLIRLCINFYKKLREVPLPLVEVILISPLTNLEIRYLRPHIRLNILSGEVYLRGIVLIVFIPVRLLCPTIHRVNILVRLSLLRVRVPTYEVKFLQFPVVKKQDTERQRPVDYTLVITRVPTVLRNPRETTTPTPQPNRNRRKHTTPSVTNITLTYSPTKTTPHST